MDFAFSSEHEQIRATVRRFSESVLAPLVEQAEESETFPRQVWRQWAELGLLGVRYPAADGGAGFDKVADCIVREETSRVCQSFAAAWSAHTHVGLWPIWRAGTDAQKERYFRPGLRGERISGFAVSEPDIGSDVRSLKTRAEKVAGGYRLTGSKLYITNAPFADMLLIAARTRPGPEPEAISLFIVELPNPAIRITKLHKEGIRASDTGMLYIEDAFVPDECLLGGREGTYPIIMETLSENRVGVSANCLGMAQAAFEAARAFAKERKVRGQPVSRFQAIAHHLADMAAEIESVRWLVYYGAWRVDQGTIDLATSSKVKLMATEAAVRISEMAIRIHGGAGIMREYPVGRIHRDALVYTIAEGTAEIQRNIIARSLDL
ncbi:MAG TPA: acyl-CoA dehydrogenase family protein [bacterium]|nr:acyl-CoA dehydrogenase family protein [bacterium]